MGIAVTLILTWMYPFGIIMGADSAITLRNQSTGKISGFQTGVQKVFPIPKIKAGISCWGNGRVGDEKVEQYIPDFIESNEEKYVNIHEFAILFQDAIRCFTSDTTSPIGSYEYRYGNRGFHLAGFVDYNKKQVPTFYHIHNGLSEVFTNINPRKINANQDWTPKKVYDTIEGGMIPYVRNGDFLRFTRIFDSLYDTIMTLSVDGKRVRMPAESKFRSKIEAYSEFVRFWIRLTRDVYALSDLPEIIGGEISILAISSTGEYTMSKKQ